MIRQRHTLQGGTSPSMPPVIRVIDCQTTDPPTRPQIGLFSSRRRAPNDRRMSNGSELCVRSIIFSMQSAHQRFPRYSRQQYRPASHSRSYVPRPDGANRQRDDMRAAGVNGRVTHTHRRLPGVWKVADCGDFVELGHEAAFVSKASIFVSKSRATFSASEFEYGASRLAIRSYDK